MSFTFAIGDIHGSLDKLRVLIARCEQHASGAAMKFVLLGDYIDRGPESAGVIQYLLDLRSRHDSVITLKGNHEGMLLDVLDGRVDADFWLAQGGAQTLRSYGVETEQALPRTHLAWLRALQLSHDDGRRFFAHAGINPKHPLDAQRERDLIWIREPFLSDDRDYGRLIVHGHTPLSTGTPELRANRLNLDTAAVFGGPLSAAVFSDGQTRPAAFLQAS